MWSAVALLIRGIAWRKGLSIAILLVATLAVTAAAAGPIYMQAGGESILQDMLRSAGVLGTGIDVSEPAAAQPDPLSTLQQGVEGMLQTLPANRLFAAPVGGLEAGGGPNATVDLAFRQSFCQQVRIVQGQCPAQAGQVAVSATYFHDTQLNMGDHVAGPGGPLIIAGTYQADENAPYWFGRNYFLDELSNAGGHDTFFTPRGTFARLGPSERVVAVVDLPLRVTAVRLASVGGLTQLVQTLSVGLPQAVGPSNLSTTLPVTLSNALDSWHAMSVPVWLTLVQLIGLGWLLLFLVVANAAEARGGEIALAKLRGLAAGSVISFGIGEVLLLLLVAFPLGVLCAWLGVRGLAQLALVSGIPVELPGLTAIAAAAAVAGGAVAAALASWRTLRRPVIEQLRRTEARPATRPWVVDAVVVTLLAAGLVELTATGVLRSGRIDPIALITPGLVALAAALLGSRALPYACRAAFPMTRGRIAPFLAVREVARRPETLRTVLVVAAAFGLATFSVAASTTAGSNAHDVAWTQVGAAQVLTVARPPGQDLTAVVDRLDPTGTQAMVVDEYTDFSSSARETLAVDPLRFSRVAYWRQDFTSQPLSQLLAKLHPPEPPPVLLSGDGLEVTVATQQLSSLGSDMVMIIAVPGSVESEVDMGRLVPGTTQTLQSPLTGCGQTACELRQILIQPERTAQGVGGTVLIENLRIHSTAGWQPLSTGLTHGSEWVSVNAGQYSPPDQVEATAAGLVYTFNTPAGNTPGLAVHDAPNPLPAIVASGVATSGDSAQVAALDGNLVMVQVVGIASALPAAADNGVIVDRTYAERIANNTGYTGQQEVWLSPAAGANFATRLQAAGVQVLRSRRAADLAASLSRQGPGLALLLFLAAAGAAGILAAAGSALSIHLSARRRGYELAALRASGVRTGTLTVAILVEYALLLGVGALLGVAAGVVAAHLALPSVPEFVSLPAAPPLLYSIAPVPIAVLVGSALLLLGIVAVASATRLATTARSDRLREAEQ